MDLSFVKMNGLGNDFVVIEDLPGDVDLSPTQVERLCDRHFGIGADGIILIRRREDVDGYYMHYFNADGSLAEMCGNGVRCFAKYLVDRDLVDGDSFVVGTLGGPRRISVVRDRSGRMREATVDMGAPILEPALVPIRVNGDVARDVPIDTPEGTIRITAVSMGNPHAVIWVQDVDAVPIESIGPFIETHPLFPNKTNVEFAEVLPTGRVRLRVWERGVGETLACGTGACATIVAGALSKETGREAAVELSGGVLQIRWLEDDTVTMTGPAEQVFEGTIEL